MVSNLLKVFIFLLGISLLGIWQVEAQNRSQPTWITFSTGHQEYYGDLGNEIFSFDIGYNWIIGTNIDQYLHKFLDLEMSVVFGELDYLNTFNTTFISSNAIFNFKPIRSKYRIEPFVGTGIGVTPFWYRSETTKKSGSVFQIPLQLGVDFKLTENITANIKTRYNRTFSDDLDASGGALDIDGRDHDDFMVYSIGLKINIKKTKDMDRDGIPDKDDLCPNTYGTSFWGCPDSDGDGIPDDEDACPTERGRSALNGCPDSDKDGIINSKDQCPNLPGIYENNGCPNDYDTDGDGIRNDMDQCPDEAGVAVNDGCPKTKSRPLDETIKKDLQNIIENLQFDVNSATIDSTSYKELNRLAEIMLEDSELRLIIRGHTDNTGNPNDNLELSVNRANAVKDYLVQQGVPADRIVALGYGDTKPIAPNDTEEGRTKNRRIELLLYYN